MVHREDITEAKQAEQQREAMAQSEKLRALGQMATGIAHDLNQSLMLVASYSNLARQALVQTPPDLIELQDLLTTTTQAAPTAVRRSSDCFSSHELHLSTTGNTWTSAV
jgi:phosphoglycerate-specific signal transduction histidine kinase